MHLRHYLSLLAASFLVQHAWAQNASIVAQELIDASTKDDNAPDTSDPPLNPFPISFGVYQILITASPIGPKVRQQLVASFLEQSFDRFQSIAINSGSPPNATVPMNRYTNILNGEFNNTSRDRPKLNLTLTGGPHYQLVNEDVKVYLDLLKSYVDLYGHKALIPSLTVLMYNNNTHLVQGQGILDTRAPKMIATSNNTGTDSRQTVPRVLESPLGDDGS